MPDEANPNARACMMPTRAASQRLNDRNHCTVHLMHPAFLSIGAARALMTVASVTAASHALAQATTAGVSEVPIQLDLGFERVKLPGDESMGLLGGSVLFPLGHQWWAGPTVYGAASGQRGGLFVGGAELQRHWALPWQWDLRTGVYAGGGGGAAAPVGGGLMLRYAATLTHPIGPLRGGVSWSHVRFPSGDIRSSQVGLVLSWERPFRYFNDSDAVGRPQPASGPTGLGFQHLAGTASVYSLRGSDTRRLGLIGGRAEWQPASNGVFTALEAAAAASGGAGGYMEILGDVGWRWSPWPSTVPLALETRLGLGLGGGGGVPTEGGPIGKWSLGVSTSWPSGWRAGIEVGEVRGIGSPLRGRAGQLWVAMPLEAAPDVPAGGTVTRNEWSAVLQHHVRVRRNDGSTQSLDTVGMKLNRYIGAHTYLSAQAHSAYAGGAGAYSIGLIGAGLATKPRGGARFGAEVLAGAAGGGGVASGSGAVVQSLAWAGWAATPESQWRVGIGAIKALRGDMRSGVLEIGWTRALGLGGP